LVQNPVDVIASFLAVGRKIAFDSTAVDGSPPASAHIADSGMRSKDRRRLPCVEHVAGAEDLRLSDEYRAALKNDLDCFQHAILLRSATCPYINRDCRKVKRKMKG